MDSKKIIEKLLKIAEQQQKIITKLAQALPEAPAQPMGGATLSWDDVSEAVSSHLKALPAAKGFGVNSAEFSPSSGAIRGKLIYPKGSTKFHEVSAALKSALMGTTLKDNNGKMVQVTKDPQNISFIGMT